RGRWGEAGGDLSVYLHGVADPGNVGAIIGSAHALADGPVALGPGCADPYSPKAVRASMGSLFARPPLQGALADMRGTKVALDPRGDLVIDRLGAAPPLVVCLGAERDGIPPELEGEVAEGAVDATLPGAPPVAVGHLHLLTSTRREIEDIFVGLGYRVMEGPEVERDYYNFTALNHPPGHPARMLQDTFYVDPDTLPEGTLNERGLPPGPRDVVLRTHTSPMQVRSMEAHEPPIFIVIPGKVYRRDSDATHTPMFHQVDGLAVADDITLADLQGTLLEAARAIFGADRELRIRPHYFPFTEPSVELDVDCFRCKAGRLDDGSRCPLCKGTGWLEILGAGMVDPTLYEFVRESGYDPER